MDEIATIAATGVTRALDARQTAGVELSSEELTQVSGGAINGGVTPQMMDIPIRSIYSAPIWGMYSPPPVPVKL